jgi:hypothetical protein
VLLLQEVVRGVAKVPGRLQWASSVQQQLLQLQSAALHGGARDAVTQRALLTC